MKKEFGRHKRRRQDKIKTGLEDTE